MAIKTYTFKCGHKAKTYAVIADKHAESRFCPKCADTELSRWQNKACGLEHMDTACEACNVHVSFNPRQLGTLRHVMCPDCGKKRRDEANVEYARGRREAAKHEEKPFETIENVLIVPDPPKRAAVKRVMVDCPGCGATHKVKTPARGFSTKKPRVYCPACKQTSQKTDDAATACAFYDPRGQSHSMA